MKVYMNYWRRPLVFSNEALEMMGRPRYVTFLMSRKDRVIFLVPLRSRRKDIGMTHITDAVYQEGGAYAVATTPDFLYEVCQMAGVTDNALYSVEAEPYFIDEIKAGQCGVTKGIKVKGMSLRLDLSKAQIDFMEEYPVFTYGGYVISVV